MATSNYYTSPAYRNLDEEKNITQRYVSDPYKGEMASAMNTFEEAGVAGPLNLGISPDTIDIASWSAGGQPSREPRAQPSGATAVAPPSDGMNVDQMLQTTVTNEKKRAKRFAEMAATQSAIEDERGAEADFMMRKGIQALQSSGSAQNWGDYYMIREQITQNPSYSVARNTQRVIQENDIALAGVGNFVLSDYQTNATLPRIFQMAKAPSEEERIEGLRILSSMSSNPVNFFNFVASDKRNNGMFMAKLRSVIDRKPVILDQNKIEARNVARQKYLEGLNKVFADDPVTLAKFKASPEFKLELENLDRVMMEGKEPLTAGEYERALKPALSSAGVDGLQFYLKDNIENSAGNLNMVRWGSEFMDFVSGKSAALQEITALDPRLKDIIDREGGIRFLDEQTANGIAMMGDQYSRALAQNGNMGIDSDDEFLEASGKLIRGAPKDIGKVLGANIAGNVASSKLYQFMNKGNNFEKLVEGAYNEAAKGHLEKSLRLLEDSKKSIIDTLLDVSTPIGRVYEGALESSGTVEVADTVAETIGKRVAEFTRTVPKDTLTDTQKNWLDKIVARVNNEGATADAYKELASELDEYLKNPGGYDAGILSATDLPVDISAAIDKSDIDTATKKLNSLVDDALKLLPVENTGDAATGELRNLLSQLEIGTSDPTTKNLGAIDDIAKKLAGVIDDTNKQVKVLTKGFNAGGKAAGKTKKSVEILTEVLKTDDITKLESLRESLGKVAPAAVKDSNVDDLIARKIAASKGKLAQKARQVLSSVNGSPAYNFFKKVSTEMQQIAAGLKKSDGIVTDIMKTRNVEALRNTVASAQDEMIKMTDEAIASIKNAGLKGLYPEVDPQKIIKTLHSNMANKWATEVLPHIQAVTDDTAYQLLGMYSGNYKSTSVLKATSKKLNAARLAGKAEDIADLEKRMSLFKTAMANGKDLSDLDKKYASMTYDALEKAVGNLKEFSAGRLTLSVDEMSLDGMKKVQSYFDKIRASATNGDELIKWAQANPTDEAAAWVISKIGSREYDMASRASNLVSTAFNNADETSVLLGTVDDLTRYADNIRDTIKSTNGALDDMVKVVGNMADDAVKASKAGYKNVAKRVMGITGKIADDASGVTTVAGKAVSKASNAGRGVLGFVKSMTGNGIIPAGLKPLASRADKAAGASLAQYSKKAVSSGWKAATSKVGGFAIGLAVDGAFYYHDAGRDMLQVDEYMDSVRNLRRMVDRFGSSVVDQRMFPVVMERAISGIDGINTLSQRHGIKSQVVLTDFVNPGVLLNMQKKLAVREAKEYQSKAAAIRGRFGSTPSAGQPVLSSGNTNSGSYFDNYSVE